MASSKASFQAPKGTRDFYPEDLLRQRYITESWRAVSVRHGFEEITGPTFESAELYTVKSGEGILSELFSFTRTGGESLYALRPEFTPTLARMYAARAKQLPKPTRWFCIPSFFRAERPQRGRLREFLQWNVDLLGDGSAGTEATDIDVVQLLEASSMTFGLDQQKCRVHVNNRELMVQLILDAGADQRALLQVLTAMDARAKVSRDEFHAKLEGSGFLVDRFDTAVETLRTELSSKPDLKRVRDAMAGLQRLTKVIEGGALGDATPERMAEVERLLASTGGKLTSMQTDIESKLTAMRAAGAIASLLDVGSSVVFDPTVVRGLAYYTGTVFELLADGERAIAGGGRYDGLVELVGGPATPAVGFAMGDVVLSLLLQDNGLIPEGAELMDAVQRIAGSYSIRPDVFVVPNGDEDCEGMITPLLSALRRGIECDGFTGAPWSASRYSVAPLHARTTDKSTRNLKKLLADANKQFARCFVEVHGAEKVELRDLDRGESVTPKDVLGIADSASFSIDPASPSYVGRGVEAIVGKRSRLTL